MCISPVSYTHLDVYKRQYQETPVTVSVEDAAGTVAAQAVISKAGTVTLELSLIHICLGYAG